MLVRYLLVASTLQLSTGVFGRNIIDLHPEYDTTNVVHNLQGPGISQTLLDRDFGGARCGSGFGRCSNGNCCSTAGMRARSVLVLNCRTDHPQDTVETQRVTVVLQTVRSTMAIAMHTPLQGAHPQRGFLAPSLGKLFTVQPRFAIALSPEPLL
jgi:hypothetical protein